MNFDAEELARVKPEYVSVLFPSTEDKLHEGFIGRQISLSMADLNTMNDKYMEGYIIDSWKRIYGEMFEYLAERSYGKSEYLVVKFIPKIVADNMYLELRLYCEIGSVQQRTISVPQLEYYPAIYEPTFIEILRVGKYWLKKKWKDLNEYLDSKEY